MILCLLNLLKLAVFTHILHTLMWPEQHILHAKYIAGFHYYLPIIILLCVFTFFILFWQVFNAKKLSSRYVPHAYGVISLNEVKVCRTQVKEAPDACWDEEFILELVSIFIYILNHCFQCKLTASACQRLFLCVFCYSFRFFLHCYTLF